MFSLTAAEKSSLRRRQNTTASPEERRQKNRITRTGRGYFKVRSFYDKPDVYNVTLHRSGTYPNGHCTCSDFIYRRYPAGETCKHLDACLLWFGLEDCETQDEETLRKANEAATRKDAERAAANKAASDNDPMIGLMLDLGDLVDELLPEGVKLPLITYGEPGKGKTTFVRTEERTKQPLSDLAAALLGSAGPVETTPLGGGRFKHSFGVEAAEKPKAPRMDTITTITLPASLEQTIALLDLAKRLASTLSTNAQAAYDRFEVRPTVTTVNGEQTNSIAVVGIRKEG